MPEYVEPVISRVRMTVYRYPSGQASVWVTGNYLQDLGYRVPMSVRTEMPGLCPRHSVGEALAAAIAAVAGLVR